MKNENFLSKTILTTIALCAVLCFPHTADAQFKKLKEKVKTAITTTTDSAQNPANDSINPAAQNRDVEEAIDNAYVFYLSKVERFEARFHDAGEVTKEARDYAAKLDAALRANPQYRTRNIGSIVRDDSLKMTAAELLDKLNRAGDIISQGQSDLQAQNMSYFVQGDVDDWKNRMNRLDGKDGFILLANYEYPLIFNREAGEREALAKYSKGNGGKPLPASVIKPLHNQIDELLAKMNADAPNYSFSGGTAKQIEPAIFSSIVKQAPGNIPGATVLRTAWLGGEWIIDKNDLGIPTMRSRLGTALYRVPSQKFCVEQHFFYEEKYAGGGRYARAADVNFSDLRFVKCQ